MFRSVAEALLLVAGLPVGLCGCYLLTLATASLLHRPPPASGPPRARLAVLVPAHDEAEMIGRCVRSLLSQRYPRDRYRVVVVADNCVDETAAIAAGAGAEVLVRRDPTRRGKGHALRWGMDRLLAGAAPPDAVVVVDADAIADPDFLRELEAVFAAGHPAVQADDVLDVEAHSRPREHLEAAALLLRNRVRFSGRAALGLSASLCGNGMLLARPVLERHPWEAFSAAEDGEYSLSLLEAGIATSFALRARVMAAPTAGTQGARTQSLRWDGGRLALSRAWTARLLRAGLRRRDRQLLGAALDLVVPPLGALVMAALGGTAVAAVLVVSGLVAVWAALPWLVAFTALPSYLVVGLLSSHAPTRTYLAFLRAPWFVARKLVVYARIVGGSSDPQWVRTERPGEAQVAGSGRPGATRSR